MAYTTNTDLKIYLDIPSGTTTWDTLLTTLIARAQAVIDRYCGQSFEASADTTRYFSAASVENGGSVDGRDLILDAPLCAITSVTNGDGTVVSSGNYVKLPINGDRWYALRLKTASGLTWTYDDDIESDLIAVTGKFAYSTTAPADIVQACTRLAAYLYNQRKNANDLDRAVVVGDMTILPARIPADVLSLLESYRRLV